MWPKEHCQSSLLVTTMLESGAPEGVVMLEMRRIEIRLGIWDRVTSAALRSMEFVVVSGGGEPI